MAARKVIITCAITGSVHTPSTSDALPVTPDEIAESAIQAVKAGAAILHLHARDPLDGRPSPDPALFMAFLPRIKQVTDAVVNITTGGGQKMTVEQRIAAARAAGLVPHPSRGRWARRGRAGSRPGNRRATRPSSCFGGRKSGGRGLGSLGAKLGELALGQLTGGALLGQGPLGLGEARLGAPPGRLERSAQVLGAQLDFLAQ